MVRAAESYLRATRGAVVNVSSVAAILAMGSSLAYVASKAALNGLTLGLARVLGPEVRINSVRSEEHTSELQSLMRISYAVFCLKKKSQYATPHLTPAFNLN